MSLMIDKSRTIGSTAVYRTVLENDMVDTFAYFSPEWDYVKFVNRGEVYVTDQADFYMSGSIILVQNFFNDDCVIENDGTLSISLDGQGYGGAQPWAWGIRAGSRFPHIINNGRISVEAAAYAVAIEGWGVAATSSVNNTGLISAAAIHGTAFGLYLPNGAQVVNSGFISVLGTQTWAISLAAIGAGTITNLASGVILARTINGSGPSGGIAFFANGNTPVITNYGLIDADRAIWEYDNGNGRAIDARQEVHNYGTIKGLVFMGLGNDLLTNAGRIYGDVDMGSGHDLVDMTGGSARGVVYGGGGNDRLIGGGLGDRLNGGSGNDRLTGGGAADVLTGGSGSDLFVYHSPAGSSVAARDHVTDFVSGTDQIDLSAIDAVPSGGNNAFVWSTSAPGDGQGAGVVWFDAASHTLFASTDGDAAPEMAIVLDGVASVTVADLVL